MTRKHFIALAIELGDLWRDFDRDADQRTVAANAAAHSTLTRAQAATAGVCKRSNPRFDREHFDGFIQEIRDHQRDLDGRKIPAAKQRAAASVTA